MLKISGIGARTALAVLSGLSVAELAQAVAAQEVDTIAFVNPDGSTAIVVSNPNDRALRFALSIDDASGVVELPPRSIATHVAAGALA